jgi:hypothetical protein
MQDIERFVGIDPALTATGIVVKGLGGKVFVADTIEPPKRDHKIRRYQYLAEQVLKRIPKKRSLVLIEGYAFAATHRAVELAGVGEILRWLIWRRTGRFCLDIPPGTWKKFLCGRGTLKKEMIAQEVLARYDIKLGSSDEAVAFVLAEIGRLLVTREWGEMTVYRRNALKAIASGADLPY